jgi:hypothetical protein
MKLQAFRRGAEWQAASVPNRKGTKLPDKSEGTADWCPACGVFAHMIPCENSEQQWFQCAACGAAMDGDEIDSVQPRG